MDQPFDPDFFLLHTQKVENVPNVKAAKFICTVSYEKKLSVFFLVQTSLLQQDATPKKVNQKNIFLQCNAYYSSD